METRVQLLKYLKQHGPCGIQALVEALEVSENAVRHHLNHLKNEGFIEESLEHHGVGRPAKSYQLTLAAEGAFPKRYKELLEAILEQAQSKAMLEPLMQAVAKHLSEQIRPDLSNVSANQRLSLLMEKLDYGDMLGHWQNTSGGWEFKAYNCMYRDTGCKFEAVCNLLPNIIMLSTDLPAERVICQRDGMLYCHFAGDYEK